MARIIVTPVPSKELKHGDLYSEHDQSWWDNRDSTSIGHFCIIRNSNPFPDGYLDSVSYKITIEPDDNQDTHHLLQDAAELSPEEKAQGEEGSDESEVITTG